MGSKLLCFCSSLKPFYDISCSEYIALSENRVFQNPMIQTCKTILTLIPIKMANKKCVFHHFRPYHFGQFQSTNTDSMSSSHGCHTIWTRKIWTTLRMNHPFFVENSSFHASARGISMWVNLWLVVYVPLWKMWKSIGMMTSPTEWKNKKCSKPPTRSTGEFQSQAYDPSGSVAFYVQHSPVQSCHRLPGSPSDKNTWGNQRVRRLNPRKLLASLIRQTKIAYLEWYW